MTLTPTCVRLVLSWLMVGSLAGLAPAGTAEPEAAQTDSATASVQARLKRVGAELFSGTAQVAEAIRELKAILAIDPRSAEAHLLLGIAYRTQGSPEMMGESIAEFRQALELDTTLAAARLYLAYVYLDLGRVERAREELESALVQLPGNVQFLTLLGETERLLKHPARAAEILSQALKTDPSFVQARYYLGLALFDLGRRDEAIKVLDRVVQSGAKVADAYIALGIAYLEAGRVDEGLEILSQATHLDAARPDIRIQLARAYRLKGALQKADEQLTLARPQAGAMASPSARDRQVEFDLYLELGLLRLRQGRLDAAAEAFQKVLDMDPSHAPTLRHMAEVKRRQQETRSKKGMERE
jgi:tetratricopeptide (TPR) repeat protein